MSAPGVLIIDDDAGVQRALSSALAAQYCVHLASTGEEGLKPLMDAIGSSDLRKVCLQEPSLEDVFIALTGRTVRD